MVDGVRKQVPHPLGEHYRGHDQQQELKARYFIIIFYEKNYKYNLNNRTFHLNLEHMGNWYFLISISGLLYNYILI